MIIAKVFGDQPLAFSKGSRKMILPGLLKADSLIRGGYPAITAAK
jgi:hypothetical protein